MFAGHELRDLPKRRGAIAVFVMVSLVALLGFAALAVDMGMLYSARNEVQVAADAAALAGAAALVNEDRLRGPTELATVLFAARQSAASVAALNPVLHENPEIDLNTDNDPGGDVVIGHLEELTNQGGELSLDDPAEFNAVLVRVRRDSTRNGPVNLWFARVLGFQSADVVAQAAAAFHDGIVGYRVTPETGNAELLPLALRDTSWNELLGTLEESNDIYGDDYTYDADTGLVTEGSDGIPELNLFPGVGEGQLPPGNFGTVDFGPPNNSTADIARQILHGVNEEDLSYFGGEINLADGYLNLNGDTGLSAAVKDELAAILGRPRAVPLFDQVSGPGNNATYRVIRFAGIRIVNVRLTGPMNAKEVLVQPALVVDDAAIGDSGSNTSYFVYSPVRLVR